MTIEEAIGFNQALEKDLRAKGMTTFAEAQQLGIEALKCVKEIRHHPFPDTVLQLPGETLEGE